jgi:integrase
VTDPTQRELFPPAPTPALRLFTDEDAGEASSSAEAARPHGLSPSITLLDFYRAYVRPVCLVAGALAKRSLDQYDQSTALWARFTGDPPLDRIDDSCVAQFKAGLRTLPGLLRGQSIAEATVRKHCIHVQCVLDRAGPKGRSKGGPRSMHGAGLLAEPPLIGKPKAKKPRTKNVWTLDEIGLALDACHSAPAPISTRVPAGVWWQSLLLVVFNCSLRIGQAMSIRWAWIERDELGSWVNIPERVPGPWSNKSRRDLKPFLNFYALAAIERMRGAHEELVFPWPFCETHLHHTRKRILDSSHLEAARRYGFHAIRKRANTEMQRINPAAAKMFSGHAGGDVNLDYYTSAEILCEAAAKLPQPSFTPATGSRQLELF